MRLLLVILVLAVLVAACGENPTPIVIIVTPVTLPTHTSQPALPTNTPLPALPTYTPVPPLPTYTPVPPLPTYTPYPTYTMPPIPTDTPQPPATPTSTPQPATPTLTPTLAPTFTRTPLACVVSYATRLHVGGQAREQNDDNHNVRSQPNTSGRILGQISNGQIVDVLDGPVCGNNMWWWYVRSTSSALTGWSAEAGGGVWWLANYTGGPVCTSTTQRVTFASGGTGRKVVTTLSAGCTKSYVLRIMAGQNLAISIGGYPNPGLRA